MCRLFIAKHGAVKPGLMDELEFSMGGDGNSITLVNYKGKKPPFGKSHKTIVNGKPTLILEFPAINEKSFGYGYGYGYKYGADIWDEMDACEYIYGDEYWDSVDCKWKVLPKNILDSRNAKKRAKKVLTWEDVEAWLFIQKYDTIVFHTRYASTGANDGLYHPARGSQLMLWQNGTVHYDEWLLNHFNVLGDWDTEQTLEIVEQIEVKDRLKFLYSHKSVWILMSYMSGNWWIVKNGSLMATPDMDIISSELPLRLYPNAQEIKDGSTIYNFKFYGDDSGFKLKSLPSGLYKGKTEYKDNSYIKSLNVNEGGK
jgi:hypothetical protein